MFQSIINLFFPKSCSGCDALLLTNEKVICSICRHNIPLTNHHLSIENEAFRKFYGRIPVEHASAFLYFHKKGIVQKLIHNLKYKGHEEVGTLLGEWYTEDLKEIISSLKTDEIIPVPLHPKKYRERGYNQVTTFGKSLAEKLELNYNETILFRKVYSKTQSKKNLLGRTEGIETIFDVHFTEKDHNKHFVIIDDVITTGATLEACGRALLKIPGAKISIICIAMAQS
ncbi:comF family protein [Flavobacterium glycines]|uniref:Amidophosphoribosyltransferase n=1 Tax=Flavobacterium glycines TaxID=551990 RepID=A0A1B9DTL3_9FLAO|nr:phosphoribosyltransferase family protein [Flavobacterium glycines]OCB73035.1 amidophosphoribosyltransferase [Flavobacterium glycines]SDI78180.1 comF family protein [Flavobacterium glycines]